MVLIAIDRHAGDQSERRDAIQGGSMTVTARTVDDITILDVQGTVTVGEQAERLRDKVRSVVQEGARRILVNMAGVSYVDSAGLGELIAAYTTTTRQGGTL